MNKITSICALAVVTLSGLVFAQEHGVDAAHEAIATGGNVKMWLAIVVGLGMAFASIGGAWSQSKAISTALDGIARNPGASNKIMIPMIIGLALIESLILLTFIVANNLAGKI